MPCGNLSQPASCTPSTGSSGVSKLVSVKPLVSQSKVYALHKNKTRWFPRGQKIFLTRKRIATCQFPIPFIFMLLSKPLTPHIQKYCPRINLLLGDTLNINSEPRVNIHRQDIKLWKQDFIMVMLTKPLLHQWCLLYTQQIVWLKNRWGRADLLLPGSSPETSLFRDLPFQTDKSLDLETD